MIIAAITVSTPVLLFICGIILSAMISLGAWILSKVASLGESSAQTSATLVESVKILSRVNDELDETSKQVAEISSVVARIDERTLEHSRRISMLENYGPIKKVG